MLERLANKNAEKVRIVKVDVTAHGEWAHEQKVRGVPTFQFYSGGNKLEQFAGAPPEIILQQKIDQYAAAAVSSEAPKVAAQGISESGAAVPAVTPANESVMKPMPKEWLPPGVTRQ